MEYVTIFMAWPYVNGPLHLGHVAGNCLPADIQYKYERARGRAVLMCSGSDEHGTPITVTAEELGVHPQTIVDDFDTTMSDISRNVHYCRHDDSVDNALDILLENKIQLIVVKDQFGGTVGLVTMEDVIETLLGVEIVDESDQEAIEEGLLHEDMRELAKIRYADDESE